jgi:hypothetical protein
MTARETRDDGTPSKDEVEQDFSVPGDADLRPAVDQGGEDLQDGDES